MLKAKICPSLLSGDFAMLASECARMIQAGADYLHMDIMDGHFVPNLTMGAPVIASVRKHEKEAFLDCHLMVSRPEQWVQDYAKAGASQYTFHLEATENPLGLVQIIKSAGMKAGIAIKPATPVSLLFPLAEHIDTALVMTVEPGFGGQSFMPSCVPKVRELRERFPGLDIQVDGGLDLQTVQEAANAGANVIVAGTSIFKSSEGPSEVIRKMRNVVNNKINCSTA